MRLYSDLLSEDELFTDATKFKELEDFPGLYEVQAKLVTRKGDSIDDSAFGGNASAEEAAEDLEEGEVKSGLDVVLDMQYVEAPGDMGKKGYMVHIKEYMKAVKAKLDAEGGDVDTFMKNAQNAVKGFFIPNIKDFDFYIGKGAFETGECSMNIACKWNDDGESAALYYWKDGIKDEKV